jgi:hypothetical protein
VHGTGFQGSDCVFVKTLAGGGGRVVVVVGTEVDPVVAVAALPVADPVDPVDLVDPVTPVDSVTPVNEFPTVTTTWSPDSASSATSVVAPEMWAATV